MFRRVNAQGQVYDADLAELVAEKAGPDPREQVRVLCDIVQRVVWAAPTSVELIQSLQDMLIV